METTIIRANVHKEDATGWFCVVVPMPDDDRIQMIAAHARQVTDANRRAELYLTSKYPTHITVLDANGESTLEAYQIFDDAMKIAELRNIGRSGVFRNLPASVEIEEWSTRTDPPILRLRAKMITLKADDAMETVLKA